MGMEADWDNSGEPLMTDTPTAGDESRTTLESLPDGGLSMDQVDALGESDAVEVAAPLVIDTPTSRMTHLDLVIGETHHFVGWHPTERRWERILVVVDGEDDLVLKSAIDAFDDGSEKPAPTLDTHPEIEEILDFVWKYVEQTYADTSQLYNVMEQALDELEMAEE